MGFVNFIYLFLVAFSNSTKIFKWDIDDLEQVFCQNSIKKFNEQKDGFEQTREEANTFTKTKNKARSKLAIWPWEYNDSFEGECIEEGCQDSEVKGNLSYTSYTKGKRPSYRVATRSLLILVGPRTGPIRRPLRGLPLRTYM